MSLLPFASSSCAALFAASLASCGGSVATDGTGGTSSGTTSSGGTSSSSTSSTTTSSSSTSSTTTSSTSSSGALPPACQAAAANVLWSTCQGAAVYAWAQGLGSTWQQVFDAQCTKETTFAACQTQVDAYYHCIANDKPTCMPCVAGPDVGECKGTDGIVWSQDCTSQAFDMFACTGK
jgi:hypothetical protein